MPEGEDPPGRAFSGNLESHLSPERQGECCFLSEQCGLRDTAPGGGCRDAGSRAGLEGGRLVGKGTSGPGNSWAEARWCADACSGSRSHPGRAGRSEARGEGLEWHLTEGWTCLCDGRAMAACPRNTSDLIGGLTAAFENGLYGPRVEFCWFDVNFLLMYNVGAEKHIQVNCISK